MEMPATSHLSVIDADGNVSDADWSKLDAADAIIFGLKELPEDGTPLAHRHIMFGHAYKGQPAGQVSPQVPQDAPEEE